MLPTDITFATVAGQRTPGTLTIKGLHREWKSDSKEARGSAGEYYQETGEKNTEFELVISLWNAQDWLDWYAWIPVIDNATKEKALDFWHPLAAETNITEVTRVKVMRPEADGNGGPDVARITLRKFTPKPKTDQLARPKGATRKGQTTVEDAQDVEIRRLLEQEKALSDRSTNT